MTKSSTRKAAARTARSTHPKKAPRIPCATYQQTTKVLAEKSHIQRRKIASKGVVEQAGTGPGPATQFDEFRDNQTMSALAESGVIQTREVYERSKHALQAVLESWQMSFGAAGRGVSRRMINVAGRNITATLDLATGLAGAKNSPTPWRPTQTIGGESSILMLKLRKRALLQQRRHLVVAPNAVSQHAVQLTARLPHPPLGFSEAWA